ncbi:hypothetical protein HPP92_027165 [Vanilla planifolia]|uniref:Sulfotransferase n=1 Tax=Vanilla planifolia TaxID=51239 RepID=A0A835PDY1_VANPL|nr:hypothetical protein HPP92_027165 [Vanilla planifolia]
MAEYYCFYNKDTNTLIVKPTKKSLQLSRMLILAAVMICSAYICLFCSKQIPSPLGTHIPIIKQEEQTCHDSRILQTQLLHANYPKPKTYSREECKCTPVRLFVIVSMQRSGSGWFETLLNSHRNISSHGEIFRNIERRRNRDAIMRVLDDVYNLDWNSSASKWHCTGAVGFKWMLNQGVMDHYEEIVEYFNRRGVSAILLFRRNHLRRLISLLANIHDQKAKQLNGTHRAHVHSKDEADILAKFKPHLEVKHLISTMQEMQKWASDALQSFKSCRHMVVYYEDLVQNHSRTMDALEFLELPQQQLHSRHVKIHTRPLEDQIANWNDVVEVVKGTQYESFIAASGHQTQLLKTP